MRRLLVLLVVVLVACGGGSKTAATTTSSASTDPNAAPQTAIDACHTRVKDKLKSPGSAKFDADEPVRSKARGDGSGFYLAGTVDSQNGFGALIRNVYRCDVVGGAATVTDLFEASRVPDGVP